MQRCQIWQHCSGFVANKLNKNIEEKSVLWNGVVDDITPDTVLDLTHSCHHHLASCSFASLIISCKMTE
ncbi:hypothetical protein Pmani_016212 [Petrolisthes manimaculis]|uniref:Uncharacterized protein n=1 Tax=Petrolisthes manimaculis TaxID=1843537 RepID=A0AAE1PPF0_9EUCA|nr:hypothetical protein Pmani_016212 [Petrolisthes manimaculis]